MRRIAFAIGLIASLPIGMGCTTRHRACASPELSRASGQVEVGTRSEDPQLLETNLLRSYAERSRTGNALPASRPLKLLALSGGGMYGAYTTGVLAGWTAAGTRPPFDIVTGVSTGGLIATYAFLGSDYDRTLAELYTSVCSRDIYRRRAIGSALFSDSAASSAPLKKLIDDQVTDALLESVARAHAAGRRLYVGTTNIDTRRFVIWDLGAIAASGRPGARDLYSKILLASASPPGFLPPVPIEVEINGRSFTEMHVDGGATTGVFLRAAAVDCDSAGPMPLAGSDAYVIVAGKLYADPACVHRRAVRIGSSALDSLLYSQTRGELYRIYSLCLLSGMNYHLAALPEDFNISGAAMAFDPDDMKRLYEAGYAAAAADRAWRGTPPGAEPQEQIRPRGGVQFFAPGALK
jgi:predicted acylesterase/phospholipase RssA